jgi:hypothetical protein
LLAVVALTVSCGREVITADAGPTTTDTPATQPSVQPDARLRQPTDFVGTIVEIDRRLGRGEIVGSMLVQASTVEPVGHLGDRAALTVATDTVVGLCGPGDERVYGELSDLEVGQTVAVWVDGPVAESYPVQARAAAIALSCG